MASRVTIDDIAQRTSTSPSTVSLVLRNRPGVGDETRQRVLEVARQLGYKRRLPAAATSGQATRTVGLLLRFWQPGPTLETAATPAMGPFYSWVVMGIEAAARAQGINLLLATVSVDDENHAFDLPTAVLDQALDGVLLVGSFREETIDVIGGGRPAPLVLVDSDAAPHRFDAVASDHQGGAYTAVSHLIAAGHRRIAFVGYRSDLSPNFRQRRDGYLQALRDHGITESFIEESRVVSSDALAEARAFLERPLEVTAVFGANDAFAIAVMRAAQELGYVIPRDLSVIGFDDVTGAREMTPPLTTMAVDKVSMGRLAVQALTYRLAWPDSAPVLSLIQPRLAERGSVGRVTAGTKVERPGDGAGVSGGSREQ